MNGLISKPQFDDSVFKVGVPVQVTKTGKRVKGKDEFQYTANGKKLDYVTNGLIAYVLPLSITILLVDKKEVMIPVDAVADGEIEIKFMEVKKGEE